MDFRRTLRFVKRAVCVITTGRQEGVRRRFLRRVLRRNGAAASDPYGAPEPVAVMAGFTDVGAIEELPEGAIGEFFIGDRGIAIAHVDGQLFGIDNTCAHAGGPLGDGVLEGCTVVCPWHGWRYDVRDGVCELDPTVKQARFRVRTRDGRLLVETPAD